MKLIDAEKLVEVLQNRPYAGVLGDLLFGQQLERKEVIEIINKFPGEPILGEEK